MTEIITLCIRLLIAIICGVIAPVVKQWIETKTNNEKMDSIRKAAETAVYAAEQTLKAIDPDGSKRYNFAMSAVIFACEKTGIRLSDAEKTAIIEAAVRELNIMQYGGILLPNEGETDEDMDS